jgi:hypothetical protein
VTPPGSACTSTCTYRIPKGTSVRLHTSGGLEKLVGYEISGPGGGQTTCDEGDNGNIVECTSTLNDDTTATVTFS